MVDQLMGYISLDIVITQEGNLYSSWCPNLDIASVGETYDEALKKLADAITLYMNTVEEEGERKKVFRERGIELLDADEPVLPKSFVTQYRQKVMV